MLLAIMAPSNENWLKFLSSTRPTSVTTPIFSVELAEGLGAAVLAAGVGDAVGVAAGVAVGAGVTTGVAVGAGVGAGVTTGAGVGVAGSGVGVAAAPLQAAIVSAAISATDARLMCTGTPPRRFSRWPSVIRGPWPLRTVLDLASATAAYVSARRERNDAPSGSIAALSADDESGDEQDDPGDEDDRPDAHFPTQQLAHLVGAGRARIDSGA